eukprot:gene19817-biopygen20556
MHDANYADFDEVDGDDDEGKETAETIARVRSLSTSQKNQPAHATVRAWCDSYAFATASGAFYAGHLGNAEPASRHLCRRGNPGMFKLKMPGKSVKMPGMLECLAKYRTEMQMPGIYAGAGHAGNMPECRMPECRVFSWRAGVPPGIYASRDSLSSSPCLHGTQGGGTLHSSADCASQRPAKAAPYPPWSPGGRSGRAPWCPGAWAAPSGTLGQE